MKAIKPARPPCSGADLPAWLVPISLPTPYPIGPVTVYLLDGAPLTLIDTGPHTRVAWRTLVEALRARGRDVREIRRVLITHGHHDHFGNATRLARLGAEVWAHSHDARNLRLVRDYGGLWRHLRKAGVPNVRRFPLIFALRVLDHTTRPLDSWDSVHDGMRLPFEHGEILVHHIPGHTPGHVGFELVGENAIVTGDTLLQGITPNAVIDLDPDEPQRPFLSIASYDASLGRLQRAGARLLLPAHGPCIRDVSAQVAIVRRRQDMRRGEILAPLASVHMTVWQLVNRLFPHVAFLGTFLAYSEVFGHLLELERRGEVVRTRDGGREFWSRV